MSHEVVAALIIESGRILLGQRSPDREFYPNVWDVFGGHMVPGGAQCVVGKDLGGLAEAIVRQN